MLPSEEDLQKAKLTAAYAIALSLGTIPMNTAIPSQSAFNIGRYVEAVAQPTSSIHSFANPLIAFVGADIGFAEMVNPTSDIMNRVKALSVQSRFAEAADALLDYIIACLDAKNYRQIDSLVGALAEDLQNNQESYNDQGFGRIINVLGLTFRHAGRLTQRIALRDAYHSSIAALEDEESANRAIEHL